MDEFERPGSEQLTDLHVYVIPPDHWRAHLHSAVNQIINEAVSAGFIRVLPETNIYHLRDELEQQLGYEVLPQQYVFLKSVGRCLTRVRPKQEFQLKVKNFLPPSAVAPEIFVLEATPEIRSIPFSGSSSQSSDVRHNAPSRQLRHDTTPRSDRSEFTGHKPIPPIRNTVAIQTSDAPSKTPRTTDSFSQHHDPTHPPQRSRSRSPSNNQHPDMLAVHQAPIRNIATQYSRPPTPYYESHTPVPHHTRSPNPNDYRYERVQTPVGNDAGTSTSFNDTPRRPINEAKHVVFKDSIPDQAVPRGSRSPNPPRVQLDPPRSNQPTNRSGYDPYPYQGQGQGEHAGGGDYLPPLSASPPHSSGGQGRSQYQYRAPGGPPAPDDRGHPPPQHNANYSAEESGISDGSELLPEEQRRVDELMRQEEDEDERRRQTLLQTAEDRAEEQQRRHRAQEQLEEEVRRKHDEDDRKRRLQAAEDSRIPRPEQHPDGRSDDGRSPPNAPRGPKESPDLAALKEELRLAKAQRQDVERHREELVKKAKLLQNKTQQRRNQARDLWKKKYFEEKKQTTQMEEQRNKLKQEVEMLHRKIMSQLEGAKDPTKRVGDNKPSQQSNLKIQATRLDHDIEDLQRRVENVQMKLTTEMKLRSQAEGELKALRAELTQKKISMALTKTRQPPPPQQHQPAIGQYTSPPRSYNQQAHMVSPRS